MMSRRPLAWTASWLPLAVGAFLALVGVGTLVGAPWLEASGAREKR
ncbi:putative membrane protein [Haloferax volcanii]|nr:putative membrane protein [Haloferax lucentense]